MKFRLSSRGNFRLALVVSVVALAIIIITSGSNRQALKTTRSESNRQPTIQKTDEATGALLARYYPAAPDNHAAPSNESMLKMVADADGSGFIVDPGALSQIEKDAQARRSRPGSHPIDPAKYIRPIFPKHFADALKVGSQGLEARLTPCGANASSCAEVAADGSLIYSGAFPGCDAVYRSSALKTEEFLIVRDAGAKTEWSWNLDCGGLTPRLTPMNTIELVDAQGVPRMRIDAPHGKDVNGVLLNVGQRLKLAIDGGRLALSADLKGLAFPVVIDPSWSSTGAMAVPRSGHSAVALNNGMVLVSGGVTMGITAPTATCELYDSSSGTWSATGSLSTTHFNHTTVKLNDGSILLVCGSLMDTVCEIYSPATGTWSPTGSLPSSRVNAAVALLQNGDVLLTGGDLGFGSNPFDSCLLYVAQNATWRDTGSMTKARSKHTATTLLNGNVLIAGGDDFNEEILSCELYDAALESWTTTGSLSIVRFSHNAVAQADGSVLVTGGFSDHSLHFDNVAEVYNPALKSWSNTGSEVIQNGGSRAALLNNGIVVVLGGVANSASGAVEFYNPASGLWATTASIVTPRHFCTATVLPSSKILVTGGLDVSNSTIIQCEVFDPAPTANSQTVSLQIGSSKAISLTAQALTPTVTYSITKAPTLGTLTGTAPNLTYHAASSGGNDSIEFKVNDGTFDSAAATVLILVGNQAPTVVASASPTLVVQGQSVSLNAAGNDADGDALTYVWDFGDGSTSTSQNPGHVYVSAGTFTAQVTATDTFGATGTSSITITVALEGTAPVARFTTSDVVAFVGLPFTFDATFSTDPGNNIVQYDWNFGDGTPDGSTQIISKTYTTEGVVTATLTITDGDGLTTSTSRQIQILPANQIGLFNADISYTTKWNRTRARVDTLTMNAVVNVGDATIASGSDVALEIAGQRFTGTLDKTLRDFSDPNTKWQVKANIRNKPFGEITMKITIKKASLGLGFNTAGATVGTNPHDTVTVDIPVRLEAGGRVFDITLTTDFKFNKDGTKASGKGDGPN